MINLSIFIYIKRDYITFFMPEHIVHFLEELMVWVTLWMHKLLRSIVHAPRHVEIRTLERSENVWQAEEVCHHGWEWGPRVGGGCRGCVVQGGGAVPPVIVIGTKGLRRETSTQWQTHVSIQERGENRRLMSKDSYRHIANERTQNSMIQANANFCDWFVTKCAWLARYHIKTPCDSKHTDNI